MPMRRREALGAIAAGTAAIASTQFTPTAEKLTMNNAALLPYWHELRSAARVRLLAKRLGFTTIHQFANYCSLDARGGVSYNTARKIWNGTRVEKRTYEKIEKIFNAPHGFLSFDGDIRERHDSFLTENEAESRLLYYRAQASLEARGNCVYIFTPKLSLTLATRDLWEYRLRTRLGTSLITDHVVQVYEDRISVLDKRLENEPDFELRIMTTRSSYEEAARSPQHILGLQHWLRHKNVIVKLIDSKMPDSDVEAASLSLGIAEHVMGGVAFADQFIGSSNAIGTHIDIQGGRLYIDSLALVLDYWHSSTNGKVLELY